MWAKKNRPGIGLDFGTSTTLIAAGDRLVPLGSADPWMPSLVGYDDDGFVVVGEAAQMARPGQLIRSIKRAITERHNHVRVDARAGLRDLRADDLMTELLRRTVRRASVDGVDVYDRRTLRVGCPAMWDGRQRRRFLDVLHSVGLPVTLATLVDEPVAAAIAWLAARPMSPRRVLVFDMGGGTLDVALLDVTGDPRRVSVLASAGIAEAGDALDEAIADDLHHALGAPPRSHLTRELLLDAARRLKVALTTETTDVAVLPPDLFDRHELWYSREQLDAAFAPQLDRAEECVAAVLRAARLTEVSPGAVDDVARTPIAALLASVDVVLLSGGMTRIPYVAQRIRALVPPTTVVEPASTPPETAVVLGLAQAATYHRINRYRPPFDVLVEWDRGQSRTIYEAYTPLVESWQILRGGSDLRFVGDGRDLPGEGTGRLRMVSHSGDRIRASLGGDRLDGFPVTFGERAFEFSIYPSGHVRLVDAAGTHDGQVHDW